MNAERLLCRPWVCRLQLRIMTHIVAKSTGIAPKARRGNNNWNTFALYTKAVAHTVCPPASCTQAPRCLSARESLRAYAFRQTTRLRNITRLLHVDSLEVIRAAYRNIGITIRINNNEVVMNPCAFSRIYDSSACYLMSGFDAGFIGAMTGKPFEESDLCFSCRLTEGAPCCKAVLCLSNTMERGIS